jgi:hypothetical protein
MNASFILRSSDLPTFATGANSNGSTNNSSASSFTWNNIDMRLILGDLWDKYEYFNICLSSTVLSTSALTYASNDNKLGTIYMSGLDWTSNYDTGKKQRVPYVAIGYLNSGSISTTVGTIQYFNSLFSNSFRKSSPITNLTIFYNKISDNTPNVVATGSFPQVAFTFKVTPIIM